MLAGKEMEDKLTPRAGQVVVWAQTALGILSVILIYLTMERLLIRPWIRFPFALFYALLAPAAQLEMIILSETLGLFCLLLSVYLTVVVIDRFRQKRSALGIAFLAGLAAGAAVLVRPNLIFAWLLFLVAFPAFTSFWTFQRRERLFLVAAWKTTGLCAGGGALLIGAWLIFNYINTENLSLSPMTEVTRTFAAYNLFDKVHPQDKVLGNILDKYYRKTNANGNVQRDYLWQAMSEIWAHYQEMPIQQNPGRLHTVYLANYLGHISNYLLQEHPDVWLQNSWSQLPLTFDFNLPQTGPGYMGGDPISLTGVPVVISDRGWQACVSLAAWEAPLILGTYLLTFAAVIIGIFRVFQASDLSAALLSLFPLILALGTILSLTIFCVLAAYYNRYSVPLLPLLVICSAYVLESACSWKKN